MVEEFENRASSATEGAPRVSERCDETASRNRGDRVTRICQPERGVHPHHCVTASGGTSAVLLLSSTRY